MDKTVVIVVTCPLTAELRGELDELGAKVLERSDALLLKLLIRHLRSALLEPGQRLDPKEPRPVKIPLKNHATKRAFWR